MGPIKKIKIIQLQLSSFQMHIVLDKLSLVPGSSLSMLKWLPSNQLSHHIVISGTVTYKLGSPPSDYLRSLAFQCVINCNLSCVVSKGCCRLYYDMHVSTTWIR